MMNVLNLVENVINTRVVVPNDFAESLQKTCYHTATVNATYKDMHELVEILKEGFGNNDPTSPPITAAAGGRILPVSAPLLKLQQILRGNQHVETMMSGYSDDNSLAMVVRSTT